MKERQGSRTIIWSMKFWMGVVSFLSTTSAFLKDSRSRNDPIRSYQPKRPFNENIIINPTYLLLRKHDDDLAVMKPIPRDINSFSRIHMVGPVLENEDGRLTGESSISSNHIQRCGIPVAGHQSLAHGILCAETVIKMKSATVGVSSNPAVETFLYRYHKYGPMSCMEMLSDPEILPHLTAAMRNLV